MRPAYITPSTLARFYLHNEKRINEHAQILLVYPDGTPIRATYVDVDREGSLILQGKPADEDHHTQLLAYIQELEEELRENRAYTASLEEELKRVRSSEN